MINFVLQHMHLKLRAQDMLNTKTSNAILLVDSLIISLREFDVSIGYQAPSDIIIDFRNDTSLKVKEKAFSIIHGVSEGSVFIVRVLAMGIPIFRD